MKINIIFSLLAALVVCSLTVEEVFVWHGGVKSRDGRDWPSLQVGGGGRGGWRKVSGVAAPQPLLAASTNQGGPTGGGALL